MSLLDSISAPEQLPVPASSTINPSIDKVVFQIQQMGGKVNDLVASGTEMVDQLKGKGGATWERIQYEFGGNRTGIPQLLETVNTKFNGWPVQALIALVVCGVILVVVAILFLLSKGAASVTEYKTKKYIRPAPSDIENL